MKLFDVFDNKFNKKVYEDKMVKKFLNKIKGNLVIMDGGYKFNGDLDLSDWVLKDLSKIKEWLGGDLVEVGGDVVCVGNKNLESLGGCGLRRIIGNLNIIGTDINNLGELEYLGEKFYCDKDRFEYFLERYKDIIKLDVFFNKKDIIKIGDGKYKYINNLDLSGWPYEDLSKVRELLGGDLVEVEGTVICYKYFLRSLGGCGLRRISGFLDINESGIDDLGELEYLGGGFYCDRNKVKYFLDNCGDIVGLNLFFDRNYFKRISDNGYIYFSHFYIDLEKWPYENLSKIKEWLGGDLVEIKDDVYFKGNKSLRSLGGCGLKRIDGYLNIRETNIDDLGGLKYLGGRFVCDVDKVKYFLNNYGKVVGLDLFFYKKNIIKLKDNKYKYDNILYLQSWPYEDLSKVREWLGGDLVEVNGSVYCEGNKNLISLGGCGLRRISGSLDIRKTGIVDLGELDDLGFSFLCDEDRVDFFKKSKWGKVLKDKIIVG